MHTNGTVQMTDDNMQQTPDEMINEGSDLPSDISENTKKHKAEEYSFRLQRPTDNELKRDTCWDVFK